MQEQLVFTVHPGHAIPAQPVSLADAGLRERSDLQEWVRAHPQILGPDVRIVTFEFSGWQSRSGAEADRLDLLGIDHQGHLVVAELKRGSATDTIEMQAIKYAAFASRFTPQTLAEHHASYLSRASGTVVSTDDALTELETHVGSELDSDLLRQPRIILVAAGFSPQVTASAVWLSEMGVKVSLVQIAAHRSEHDIVLTVSQLWPQPDVEEFTVSPRQAAIREAEQRTEGRREANAVSTLIAESTVDEGTLLYLRIAGFPTISRTQVADWIATDPQRGIARWHNDARAPLIWLVDGAAYSPGGLAKEIIQQASGQSAPKLAGPRCWATADGATLGRLAGFGARPPRSWEPLHATLETLQPGEWTSYADLATAIGSAARPVGQHVATCPECVTAYRVLSATGGISPGFRWSDPTDTRDPQQVLKSEGIRFVDGRADPSQRVDADALIQRMS